ncbi:MULTISPECIES: ABC transporter permease subunit [unclassified Apibacter]|uniref:ABC transporter permease subunit n=1 Tax=unclassified Apibacter TaxID=2630820 RepID=UPI00132BE3C8|nr:MULTISPECIES: ABC transporter permease subunit [unclassified Apibacter]MCX8677070.1 ABC transporter permease [Apibacter sp. B3919]MXO24549.1 ABC transporter permease subunit [Apibacter sp. B3924]MXO25793.1 ABC transporter permease subunit [Apibacter sp. B3813]MXO27744.1 ABC transporter permease subunit [Apibacter sp. B3913]MXO29896.1 ABC transporter permease subunit [Apibacter sp. B3912]
MFSIFKKELWAYFGTLGAYIVSAAFLLICSLFLWFFDNDFNVFNVGLATLNNFFILAPWVLMFLLPALTMKSIAEEEQNGTLVWLFSQPLSVSSIVLGKYWAILVLVLFSLLPTFTYVYTINNLSIPKGNIDSGIIVSGYIGLLFLSMTFASIGIFCSSLVKNQVLAFVTGVFFCFICFYGFENLASYNLLGNLDYTLQKIGFFQHYTSFTKGIVDTRDIGYFIFVIVGFLLLSIRIINSKK